MTKKYKQIKFNIWKNNIILAAQTERVVPDTSTEYVCNAGPNTCEIFSEIYRN